MTITQEVASFSLTLNIVQLLAEHQVILVERQSRFKLPHGRVTIT